MGSGIHKLLSLLLHPLKSISYGTDEETANTMNDCGMDPRRGHANVRIHTYFYSFHALTDERVDTCDPARLSGFLSFILVPNTASNQGRRRPQAWSALAPRSPPHRPPRSLCRPIHVPPVLLQPHCFRRPLLDSSRRISWLYSANDFDLDISKRPASCSRGEVEEDGQERTLSTTSSSPSQSMVASTRRLHRTHLAPPAGRALARKPPQCRGCRRLEQVTVGRTVLVAGRSGWVFTIFGRENAACAGVRARV
ncbi:hypothetical protein C8R45DRAFT_87323 [Mycena sanguinolenta]|nr:hypothetical protein C8R45DRAFT_87323 [Mycena sanguinolenta]